MYKIALYYFLNNFLNGFPFSAKKELECGTELKPFDQDQKMILVYFRTPPALILMGSRKF